MPVRDLGEVQGKDGGFGEVSAEYFDNGGDPNIEIEAQGDNQAKNFIFRFLNIARSPLSSSQIEDIANDEVVTSSNVLTGTGLTTLWARIKSKFALKSHTHDASDITAGELASALLANGIITNDMLSEKCVTADKIADGTIGIDQLEKGLGDSISQLTSANDFTLRKSASFHFKVGELSDFTQLVIQNNWVVVEHVVDGEITNRKIIMSTSS